MITRVVYCAEKWDSVRGCWLFYTGKSWSPYLSDAKTWTYRRYADDFVAEVVGALVRPYEV